MQLEDIVNDIVNTRLRQHFDILIENGDEYEINYWRRDSTQEYWRREWRYETERFVNSLTSLGYTIVRAE